MLRVKCAGIYIITHESGKFYIGCSQDLFYRWSGHFSDIKLLRHSSKDFEYLFNTTNIDSWDFKILERISITEFKKVSGYRGKTLNLEFKRLLLSKEKEWMSKYPKSLSLNKDNKWFI